MSNNGNMIMTTNTHSSNNNISNNTPLPILGGMRAPPQMYYMNQYVGYPPMMQPMINYNYMNSPVPMYYNPNQMPYTSPLNNYNRNLGLNSNYTPNSMPLGQYNTNPNAPIKLMANNSSNIVDNQSGQRLQRSISSKGSRLDNSNNYNQNSNNESSFRRNKGNEGPFTNPESFNRIRGYSSNSNSNLDANYDNGYKPYSLKDYKDITSVKLVLGGLGANTGTKEWMEKQEKMKKMEEYAKSVKGQAVVKFVKETPTEIIEKKKKEKIEASNRFRSYEYAKLIREKPKSSFNSNGYKIGLDLEDEMNNYKYNNNNDDVNNTRLNRNLIDNNDPVNSNKRSNEQNINRRYTEDHSNTRDYIPEQNSDNYSRGDIFFSKSRLSEDYKKDDLEFLKIQKQREVLNLKLNEIKESLLK